MYFRKTESVDFSNLACLVGPIFAHLIFTFYLIFSHIFVWINLCSFYLHFLSYAAHFCLSNAELVVQYGWPAVSSIINGSTNSGESHNSHHDRCLLQKVCESLWHKDELDKNMRETASEPSG